MTETEILRKAFYQAMELSNRLTDYYSVEEECRKEMNLLNPVIEAHVELENVFDEYTCWLKEQEENNAEHSQKTGCERDSGNKECQEESQEV